ncbi:hypothetical protein RQP46_003701 [Phenoliferia psychrophenolica]
MARSKQIARKSYGGQAPMKRWTAQQESERERQERNSRFTNSAVEAVEDAIEALQRTLAPRADSPGTSPFLLALSPWLERDPYSKEWDLLREEEEDLMITPNDWKVLVETVLEIFGGFKDPDHSERISLAGPYGIQLVWKIVKSTRQTRAPDSFLSLLPVEVLRIIIELTDLDLHLVDLCNPNPNVTFTIPFHLRVLKITNGYLHEDVVDALLTSIATTTPLTLERLSLNSAKAVRKHLPSLSRNLVELSLTGVKGESGYFSSMDLGAVDLRALRKLTLPRSELHTLLALPPADAPPDAPRFTISQTIPQLEHLVVLCAGSPVYHDDLSNLDRLLRLPVCMALRSLALEDAEFDEEMPDSEIEVLSNTVVVCKGRGLEVRVNGERQW